MEPHKELLVSVIIPFYNEEELLGEAIESVLHQTYEHWELILVDDGSADASTNIAKNYAAEHPEKIMYCAHHGHLNKGLSATRNEGVKQAKGELIAFLDADDVWLPEKLRQQLTIFTQHPEIGMLAEASEYWFSWCEPEKENCMVAVGVPQDKVYQPFELVYRLYPLNKQPGPCPSALMLRKTAIDKVGGFEEAFIRQNQLYEDQAFLIKIYLKEKTYVSSACTNRYRQRRNSIMSRVHAEGHYLTVRKFFLEWLQTYLDREQITDPKTRKLLQKALWPYKQPQLFFMANILPARIIGIVKRGIRKFTASYG